jgi:hypothetical protein
MGKRFHLGDAKVAEERGGRFNFIKVWKDRDSMMIKDFSITLHYFATLCDLCVSAVKFKWVMKNVPRGTL